MTRKQILYGSFKKLAVCSFLLVMAIKPALAEELHTRFFRDMAVGTGLHFQRWSGEGDLSIQELSIPVTFVLPLSKKLSLDLVMGSGFASLDQGASNRLSGVTNTKVRASYILGDEVALLTAGISLPTGKTGLDDKEQAVSNYLSQNALGFRTPNFGQGLDLNLGIAAARKMGETVVGLGAGYLLKGEFSPLAGGPDYKPGAEFNLTAGLDRKVLDGDGKLTLDLVYTLYGEDQRGGDRAYRTGNKILVRGLGRFRAGGLDWGVHLVERSKGKNTSYTGGTPVDFDNGNQMELGVSALKGQSPTLSVRGTAELKLYSANDRGRGKANLVGLGPGIRYKLSPTRVFDLNLKYGRGSIDGTAVRGIELSGGVWIRL